MFKPYVSFVTIDEIKETPHSETRRKMFKLVDDCSKLPEHETIDVIANKYISNEIIPEKYYDDALHIAFATFHKIDYLVTWNMKHIAHPSQRKKINEANVSLGLFIHQLTTPEELIREYEEEN